MSLENEIFPNPSNTNESLEPGSETGDGDCTYETRNTLLFEKKRSLEMDPDCDPDEIIRLRWEIVALNRPLIGSIAKHIYETWETGSFNHGDLNSYGLFGAFRATQDYDPEMGNFSTYAYTWVASSIMDAIIDSAFEIRIPEDKIEELWKLEREILNVEKNLERALNPREVREIATKLFRNSQKVESTLQARLVRRLPRVEFDGVYGSDGNPKEIRTFPKHFPPIHSVEEEVIEKVVEENTNNFLRAKLDTLEKEHIKLLTLRFGLDGGEPLTMIEASKALGLNVTRQAISIREKKALEALEVCLGDFSV